MIEVAMDDKSCNLLESCGTPEAPFCPLQEISLKNAVWYGDEPVCKAEQFQNLSWIKKQKVISDLGLDAEDGFFTIKMLNALKIIGKNLKGADPNDPRAETKWLEEHEPRPRQKHAKAKKVLKNKIKKPSRKRLF